VPIRVDATAGTGNATVNFPAMTAMDAVTLEPTINCSGAFVGSPRVFVAKDATKQTGMFPVSGTATTVSCTALDDAGNPSPTLTFTVTVGCPAGTTLTSGICQGASTRTSHAAQAHSMGGGGQTRLGLLLLGEGPTRPPLH
jgi:hypothetical protein